MNLKKKKQLASKTLGIGKNRIIFNTEGLSEIKEAITKQDIRDLLGQGIITIKPIKGRKKLEKRKTRRGCGKIKMKINRRKQEYVKITRKLRSYLQAVRSKGDINREQYRELRKKIKMRGFKNKVQFKDHIAGLSLIAKKIKTNEDLEKKKEVKKTRGKK